MTMICLVIWLSGYPVIREATAETPAWNYGEVGDGDEGWGELSPDYAPCTIGTSQSPINISYTTLADLPKLAFHYVNEDALLATKDHTLVVTPTGKSTLSIGGTTTYTLNEIRFHSPAEHSVLSQSAFLEVQLIHKDPEGKLLIVASLANVGGDNTAMEAITEALSAHKTTARFSAEGLVRDASGYFAYSGSLTWPPCTEGVQWRILKQRISISQTQFHILTALLGRNARLPQPVYLRSVQESRN